jgi:hypothetical protein
MIVENDSSDQDLVMPLFGDSRLTSEERLNESKLYLLLEDHCKEEQESLLTLSLKEIEELQVTAKQLKDDCGVSQRGFLHFLSYESFWMQLKSYVEHRKTYIRKLI